MPSASQSVATLRPDLAGSFQEIDLAAQEMKLIATQVFPVFPTAKKSGPFGRIPIEELLAKKETSRSPGSRYARGDWTFITDSFACHEHGWEEPVDDEESEIYAEYFDAELVSTERARGIVLRNAEERVKDAVSDTGTLDNGGVSGGNAWSDASNAAPIDDVTTARKAIYSACGLIANTVIMSWTTLQNLRNTGQLIERITSNGAGDSALPSRISLQQIAEAFNVDQVLVGGAVENTADEGQTASIGSIWEDAKVIVAKVPMSRDIREPGLGRTMFWTGGGRNARGIVESYREEGSRSNIIRVRHDVDEKLLYKEAGYIITGAA